MTAADLFALLEPSRPTAVLDVGANPLDDEVPYRELLRAGRCRVTGFEPQAEALARLQAAAGPFEAYLPHALGDGRRHQLRVCAPWQGCSGLFEPDPRQLALLVDFARMVQVVDRVEVDTARLDDLHLAPIDHVKIDVQGAELMVFQHGRRTLEQVTSLQVEVGFHRLYHDQPLFADVDGELRQRGFVPVQFVQTRTWPLAPAQWADAAEEQARTLVEADVLYVRDLARLPELDDEQLVHLALYCEAVYRQWGVAHAALAELARRGSLDGSEVAAWLAGRREVGPSSAGC